MMNENLVLKPKLTSAERKIINLVIPGLPSENSRRAYQRHPEEFSAWHAGQDRPELNKALKRQYLLPFFIFRSAG
jgi:hypothetical protein